MAIEKQAVSASQNNWQLAAQIVLLLLLLSIVLPLVSVYQTRHQLVSPLIPESTVWEINNPLIFTALFSAIGSIIGLLLYFFKKYVWVIACVVVVLVSEQFIHI